MKQRLMEFFRKIKARRLRSLRIIIAFSFIGMMTAVYGSTSYMLGNKFQQINQMNMENVSMQVANQVEYIVRNYINDISDVSDYIIFQAFMKHDTPADMPEILQTIISSREDVETILLLDEKGNLLAGSSDTPIKESAEITGQRWFMFPVRDKKGIYFSEPHVQNLFYDSYPWVITLSRNAELYAPSVNNVLMMDIRLDELARRMQSVSMGIGGYIYIVDKYGNIVYHQDQQYIHYGLQSEDIRFALSSGDGSYMRERDGNENFTVVKTSLYTGWKIVVVNNVDEIMVPHTEMTTFLIITIALGLLAIVGMSFVVSMLVSRPVLKLEQSMASVEQGNFDMTVDVRGDNEVERLSAAFNKMVAKIKALTEEIVREQEGKRRSELKALQTQIHPHFLYNTLESVIWMAENNMNDDVVKMVSAISKLFRISLSGSTDCTSVNDELSHVENYLIIQKMRYRDQINYAIKADEEARKCLTIRLILQPIVENAIYHGIKELNEPGYIRIAASVEEDRLVFRISDNGLGMSEQTIAHIFEEGFVSSSGSGVGVKNVHERIRLYYGDGYGLSIQSVEGAGTTVTLTLPRLTQEGQGT